MKISKPIKDSSYLIYGLGLSGNSVLRFLKKKKVKKIYTWDDKKNQNDKKKINLFKKRLDEVDFIVISPGINIQKTKFKIELSRNRKKIITDLDLFYMQKIPVKSIVITGTNGKSTTCRLTQHIFKTNKFDTHLGGNIGKPLLDLKIKRKSIVIIEASSFQLSYTKFIKPTFAVILNISSDHLDWHNTMTNYKNSKFKIFSKQDRNDIALLNNKILINLFKKKNYLSKLKIVKKNTLSKIIKKKITNNYLVSEPNLENVTFAYQISKIFKIKKNIFYNAVNSFEGLPHRHEVFLKKNKITFINDSKATSFQATKTALASSKNIYWILGGLPKKKDKIDLKNLKYNIIKSYIIGKDINFFKKQLKNKVKFSVEVNLKKAVVSVLKDIRLLKKNKSTVLLSPSAASFDQFKNFEQRGNVFKKLSRLYVKKFI